MQRLSVETAKHLVAALDAHSWFSMVKVLQRKRDAEIVLPEVIGPLENLFHFTPGTLPCVSRDTKERVGSNRKGQYGARELRNFFERKKIIHEVE